MSGEQSSADIVPIRSGAEDPTYVYDDVDEADARADAEPDVPGPRPQARRESDLYQPKQVGRYLVLQEIGRGGMGVVCTAFDPKLDRKVAIKLIKHRAKPGSRRAATGQARLVREAQALAKLNHPNIVTVHDVDTYEGRLYMAMEYVEGETLAQWIDRDKRRWREILAAFAQAGEGLAAAHAANITHRDFKPSNVLIAEDGRIKVVDFGLAKNIGAVDDDDLDVSGAHEVAADDPDEDAPKARRKRIESDRLRRKMAQSSDIMEVIDSATDLKLTQAGRVVGTPAYMAPEQHTGGTSRRVGAWTDQFSFAVALYESLYGDLPFEGAYLDEVFWNIQKGRVREPPREAGVPAWVFRILCKALAAEPDDRYPSMPAMLAALADDPAKKRRRYAGYAIAAVLVGTSVFGVWNALAEDPSAVCQGAQVRLAGVWDEGTRSAVRDALLATEVPYAADTADRVGHTLDEYGRAWAKQRTEICEATQVHQEQSEALLDLRMTCLDHRRGELAALVKVLREADEGVVQRAVTAAAGIGAPEGCATAEVGGEHDLPTDPAEREEFLRLRAQLDDASALSLAGRHADAAALVGTTAVEAEQAGVLRMHGRALVVHGAELRHLGRIVEAQTVLRRALEATSKARDWTYETRAWSELIFLTGVSLDDDETARAWTLPARASLNHAGADPHLEFTLELNVCAVATRANRFQDAESSCRTALEIATRVEGRRSWSAAKAQTNLGVAFGSQERWTDAEASLREAYQAMVDILGEDHPDAATLAVNLGHVLVRQDQEDEAGELYARALSSLAASYGDKHPQVGVALMSLSAVERDRGQYDAAWQHSNRALAVFHEIPGAEQNVGVILNNQGRLASAQGDHDKALSLHQEALELLAGKHGHDHLSVGSTRVLMCRTLSDLGRKDQALVECTSALEILRTTYGDEPTGALINAHELLGQVLRDLGRKDAARRSFREAVRLAEAAEQPPKRLADVRANLASVE